MEIYAAKSVSVTSSLPPEAQKAGLERRIADAEFRLKQLDKNEIMERLHIRDELRRYKTRLDKIEPEKERSEEKAEKTDEEKKADFKRRFDTFECETCKNRRYQDDSNDSGVSFQNPTKINPRAADMAVRAHENEHVVRNRSKAKEEGMKIVSQSVTIQRAICPECGRTYTAGGVTRTRMKSANNDSRFNVGMFDQQKIGFNLNGVA